MRQWARADAGKGLRGLRGIDWIFLTRHKRFEDVACIYGSSENMYAGLQLFMVAIRNNLFATLSIYIYAIRVGTR